MQQIRIIKWHGYPTRVAEPQASNLGVESSTRVAEPWRQELEERGRQERRMQAGILQIARTDSPAAIMQEAYGGGSKNEYNWF